MSSDATGGTGLQLSRLPLRGCAKRIEQSFVFYHGEKGVEFRPLGCTARRLRPLPSTRRTTRTESSATPDARDARPLYSISVSTTTAPQASQ